MTFAPDGKFLYAAEGTVGTVTAFSVNPTSGGLTPITGSPFAVNAFSGRGMTVDPQGRYLYVSDEALNNITGFTRNTTTGALTKFSSPPFTVSSNSNPAGMAADPTGNFVYVANSGPRNNISAMRIDQSTGALSNVAGSPFTSGQHPLSLAVVTPVLISVLGIRFVSPPHGGNAGTVTMQIVGNGFQSGVAVKLTGLGSDIIGTSTTVPNASVLNTTFDLTGATPGVRNVVVTNPDNTTTTLTGGFTVEQGGAAQISVDIIGRDKIRIGTPQTYYRNSSGGQGRGSREGASA